MTTYRRNFVAGGSYFFTVNLAEHRLRLLTVNIVLPHPAFRYARRRHPFVVDAIVVLPTICIRFGHCPEETTISRRVGN